MSAGEPPGALEAPRVCPVELTWPCSLFAHSMLVLEATLQEATGVIQGGTAQQAVGA